MAATNPGGAIRDELARLDPATLRDLAALIETRSPAQPTLWSRLSPEAKEEGLAILIAGRQPTWRWWEEHLPPKNIDRTDWPASPPTPDGYRTRPWQPWELAAAAVDMAEDEVDLDCAHDVLAALAAAHHLGEADLADAYLVLEDGR